jgi:selenocysteine-specific elongation factor
MVVDAHPKRRHKRFDPALLARLAALAAGTPEDILLQTVISLGGAPVADVVTRSGLGKKEADVALQVLLERGEVLALEGESPHAPPIILHRSQWESTTGQVLRQVGAYHRQFPLRRGIAREELKSRLRMNPRLFQALLQRLVSQGKLKGDALRVWLPDHEIRFSSSQEQRVKELLARFAAHPFAPPTVKDAQGAVGDELYAAMLDLEMLTQVSPEVVFRTQDYQRMVRETVALLQKKGQITVAEIRDHFQTSRRYALAFLEHLDEVGITVREGDIRRLSSRR